jgi:Tripartite tricarboxylate transporter TctB family
MRRSGEILFSLLIVVVAAWVVYQSAGWALRALGLQPIAALFPTGWGSRSGLFPLVVGLPVFLMAIAQLVLDIQGKGASVSGDGTMTAELAPEVVRQRSIVILGTIVGFALAIWLFGFIVAVPLVTFLFLKVASHESWALSLGLSLASGLMFYMLFIYWLNIPAPPGLLLAPLLEYE